MRGKINYINSVVEWVEAHPDQPFSSKAAAQQLGLTDQQVRSALTRMRQNGAQVNVVIKGSMYRFVGWGKPTKKTATPSASVSLFEKIAELKTGVLILKDEDGNLFRAEELS